MTTNNQPFGVTPDGQSAGLWTISNSKGLTLSLTNWGAAIVSLSQADRNGCFANVALGFSDASKYVAAAGYLGATCGRYANRIAKGQFTLDGKHYTLSCNSGAHHLHGGERGFNARLWDATPYSEGDRNGIVFTLVSKDGEEGYPGELSVSADYGLDESGRLFMDFRGETDKTTILNMTNHAYWNLTGIPGRTVRDIELRINASHYLPVDETAIPMGKQMSVKGTPFDFQHVKTIGKELDLVNGGYDHCMVIKGEAGKLRLAAEASDPASGRKLTLFTDRPGMQLYAGNFLNGNPFPKHGGLCLEPQDFPDAPNHPGFPSAVLKPGETYHHRSIIEFSTLPGVEGQTS